MNEVDLGVGALTGIAFASIVMTVIALLAVRRWSDQEAVARAKARAQAHLLECRLFKDDPVQVLRSQRALMSDTLRVFRLLLLPLVIVLAPMMMVMWLLDSLYGRVPLRVGQAAVVSVDSRHSSITAPDGMVVETKPVFANSTGRTSWRIRPLRETSGTLRAASLQRRIVAGSGVAYLPEPFMGRSAIQISYPHATVFGLHWFVWFALMSIAAAIALRRPLRVVF